MVLNLGGFKFNWKQVGSIGIETEFGISSNERIANYEAIFRANLGNQTINIEGQTLPYRGDKQTALKRLYELANLAGSYPLTNGAGKYFGRFVITKINEKQAVFTADGLFFTQTFTMELKRDYDI